jgi:cerevisin
MNAVILLSLLATCLAKLDYIPNEYLIGIKSSTDGEAFSALLTTDYDLEVKKMWDLGGRVKVLHVVGEQRDVELAGELPEVKYWEHNGYAYIQQICAEGSAAGCWGLDRTDQVEKLNYTDPLTEDAVYIWGENMGTDVNVYVVDTGIDVTHVEFEGRASWGYTAEGIIGNTDRNGHGTHCSGTVGSVSYGIAKDANLIAVKVLQDTGSGPWTSVLDGMEWVRAQHVNGVDRSVISMSLGGSGAEETILNEVALLTDDGVVVVVAAGNNNGDACNYTPAQAPSAITVGATDVLDESAGFTNWGNCVDIFAPGVNVLSTIPGNITDVYDGTSMATPHVAGVIALYLQMQANPPLPSDVAAWLMSVATRDAITWSRANHDESPNLLLFANC